MNTLVQKIKSTINFKKRAIRIAFIGFLALVLSQVMLPIDLLASGPKFNFLPGDYELLRGANATKGETEWHDPVNAAPNDSVAVIVYYHNGVENTVATNTRIQVSLPNPANPAKSLVLNGRLWADNASQVTDTFTVNSGQNVFAEYIPGTTQIFRNGSQTGTPLPDGITSANGINIGNIQGCWQYAGYVVFQIKIKSPGVPDLLIQKHVANSTTDPGTQNWVKENTARPGDVLAYKLYFLNPGTAKANSVIIKDVIPANVTYLVGTTKLYTNTTGPDGRVLPDTITTNGIALGDLNPGGPNSGYIVFQVKVDSNLAVGNYTLINTGKIWASNVSQKQDTARTLVNIAGQVDLNISKLVRNVTQNQNEFVKENNALSGDTLEYKLNFNVTGNTQAVNVRINDVLPSVSGVPMHYINGSTKLVLNGNETQLPDTITTSGVSLGNLNGGTQGYITFRVRIDRCPNAGQYTLVNAGRIIADNVSQKQDTATTHLTVTPPPQPYLNLIKLVRNDTKKESNFIKSNGANPGDTLEYYVWYKNVGQASATGLIVKDVLPPNTIYIPGTSKLHFNGKTENLPDGIVGNGVSVPDLAPGADGFITFKIKVAENTPDKSVLTDTAHIFSSEGQHAQDTANTTVSMVVTPSPITPQVLGSKGLPPTGGMIFVVLVLTSVIVSSYYYIKSQKEFAQELLRSRML